MNNKNIAIYQYKIVTVLYSVQLAYSSIQQHGYELIPVDGGDWVKATAAVVPRRAGGKDWLGASDDAHLNKRSRFTAMPAFFFRDVS